MTELEKWKDKCRRQFEETRRERQAREEAEKAVLQLQGVVDALFIAACRTWGQETDGVWTLRLPVDTVSDLAARAGGIRWTLRSTQEGDSYVLRASRREDPPEEDGEEETPPAE